MKHHAAGRLLLLAVSAMALSAVAAAAMAAGDPVRGKAVYAVCTGCHSVDDDDVGPHHRGVFGRKAGSVPGFPYSPALRQASVTWDETTLDRWLANPQQLVPGTKMFFELANATDRADVIAYLKELKQP